jgi:tetratricopeptide (TPR) repeat protein
MERAIALQPENPLLRRSLAELMLAGPQPRITLAVEAGRGAVERDPSLLGSLADRLAPLELTDAQWTALAPASPVDRMDLASRLESRGLLREARALYEGALEHASAAEEALIRWRLSRLLLGVHRPAEALAQADATLAKSPGNPELLLIRARALEALKAPDTLAAYRAALASAEGRSGPVFPTESARLQVMAAAELGRDARLSTARYRRALAQRLTDESRWEAAREEWERARSEGPLDAQGEFSRGRALDATGDRARGTEALRRAVALDPARTAFRAHLAARLWENEQYMQAIFEWQTIAGQEPGNVDAHLALARAYVKSGDRERAWREYGRVLALAPGHAEAREFVAKLKARS